MEKADLDRMELDAQKAVDLLSDSRYSSLRRYLEDTERNFDDQIHRSISNGGNIGDIRALESVRQFIVEFKDSPRNAIESLKSEKEQSRIEEEIKNDNPFESSSDLKQTQKEMSE